MKDEICLIVTRAKHYIDSDQKVAFCSNSVPDYTEKKWYETLDYIVLDGPWENLEYQVKANEFSLARMERYRKELYPILNQLLGINYSERSWGFLLDTWLLYFVTVIYDRVNKLENAKDKLNKLYLCENLEDISYIETTVDFPKLCQECEFNQQLFCKVAKVLGIDVKPAVNNLTQSSAPVFKNQTWKSLLLSIIKTIFRPFIRFWVNHVKSGVILDGCFPHKESFYVSFKTMGRILLLPYDALLDEIPNTTPNKEWRRVIKINEIDKYDKVANHIISFCLPVSILEGHIRYLKNIYNIERMPMLGSAVHFYSSDAYKILASRIIENGGKILGFQHAGLNTLTHPILSEKIGEAHVDHYYYWKTKGRNGEYLPTTKLTSLSAYRKNRKNTKNSSNYKNVIFYSTNPGIYLYRHFFDDTDKFLKMIGNQHKFYNNLNSYVKQKFLLRAYPKDRGWRYKERWIDVAGPELRIESNMNCIDSLANSRIYVSDHMSTSWLEAFYIGVPIILFFELEKYMMSDAVRKLFDDLHVVGVLHPTPELAASFLNDKYNNINDWWQNSKTQIAVNNVRNNFFTINEEFIKPWSDELLSVRNDALSNMRF